MRRITALTATTAALLLVAVSAPTVGAATPSVSWVIDGLAPSALTIKKGSSVDFVWKDVYPHNIKGPGSNGKTKQYVGSVKRAKKTSKFITKRIKPLKSGAYFCSFHPGMSVTITLN